MSQLGLYADFTFTYGMQWENLPNRLSQMKEPPSQELAKIYSFTEPFIINSMCWRVVISK